MSKDQKNLKIFSKDEIKLFGDLDILIRFGFHNVPDEFLKKHLKDIVEI